MRREVPRLVQAQVEERIRQATTPLEETLLRSLIDITRDAQDVAYRKYRDGNQGTDFTGTPSYPPVDATNPLPFATAETHHTEGQEESHNLAPRSVGEIQEPFPSFFDDCLGNGGEYSVGRQNDGSSNMSLYRSIAQQACGCSEACSCFGTTLSSQSQGGESSSLNTSGAAEIPEGNFQWQNWVSDTPQNPFNQCEREFG